MSFMNGAIRSAGNRSRKLPDIGQEDPGREFKEPGWMRKDKDQGRGLALGHQPRLEGPGPGHGLALGHQALSQTPVVQAANAVVGVASVPEPYPTPQSGQIHPPGQQADPNHYNYEPQPDGAWKVYPPGMLAPPHLTQASLPRAASTADYARMRQALLPQPTY